MGLVLFCGSAWSGLVHTIKKKFHKLARWNVEQSKDGSRQFSELADMFFGQTAVLRKAMTTAHKSFFYAADAVK